jgi:hypothetical protein
MMKKTMKGAHRLIMTLCHPGSRIRMSPDAERQMRDQRVAS